MAADKPKSLERLRSKGKVGSICRQAAEYGNKVLPELQQSFPDVKYNLNCFQDLCGF